MATCGCIDDGTARSYCINVMSTAFCCTGTAAQAQSDTQALRSAAQAQHFAAQGPRPKALEEAVLCDTKLCFTL